MKPVRAPMRAPPPSAAPVRRPCVRPRALVPLLLVGALLAGGCATTAMPAGDGEPETRVECGHTTFALHPPGTPAGESVSGARSLPLSPRATETALTLDLAQWLSDWLAAPRTTPGEQLTRVMLRQRISDRISLAGLEVAAVLAELDCEGERIDQLRDRLLQEENRRLQRTTLTSIIVGAGTAVGAGAVSLAGRASAGNVLAIGGGLLEAGLGLSAIERSSAAILRHPRNLLAEMSNGPRGASAIPPIIWRYLDTPSRADPARTNRQVLLDEWRAHPTAAEPESELRTRRERLLLGEGGLYTTDDLKAREAMLNQLESRIALFNRELAQLLREFLLLGQAPD